MKNKLIIFGLALVVMMIAAFPALAQLPYTIFDRLQVTQDADFIGPVKIDGVTISGPVVFGSQIATTDYWQAGK